MNQRSPGTRPLPLLPSSVFGYALRTRSKHQIALAALSISVFLLSTAPLDIQRRIVDETINDREIWTIGALALAYGALALTEGLVKLTMNVYRAWVGECAIRDLRQTIHAALHRRPDDADRYEAGVEASIVLSEVEPIGGLLGVIVSEPILQGGLLLSVFIYMVILQPEIALVCLAVFLPQMVFLPTMQRAINRRVEDRIQTLRDVSGGIAGAFADDDAEEERQAERIRSVFELNMGIYRLKFSMNFLMNFMHHFGVAVVLGVGGWYAATGRVEIGTVVAFVSGLNKINDPWGDLVNWFRDATVNGAKYRLVADAVRRSAEKMT
ncbi:MAG: ABC transporter transmembrane domain-containing protein [Magnetospirillum sp.]|nr:ABC transporter transmembrane domain-containing protein [Magnetospirillum sp.]